jgi:hypothetical protein
MCSNKLYNSPINQLATEILSTVTQSRDNIYVFFIGYVAKNRTQRSYIVNTENRVAPVLLIN